MKFSLFSKFLIIFQLLATISCKKDFQVIHETNNSNKFSNEVSKIPEKNDSNLKLLFSISQLNEELKQSFNLNFVNHSLNKDYGHIWEIAIKRGFKGLNNAKAYLSFHDNKLLVIVISYEFNDVQYKYGNFKTLTGLIHFLNEYFHRDMTFYFENGIQKKVINYKNNVSALCGNCIYSINLCLNFPQLCNGGGNGIGGTDTPPYQSIEPTYIGGGPEIQTYFDYAVPPFTWIFNGDDGTSFNDDNPTEEPDFQFDPLDNYELTFPRFTNMVKNLKTFVKNNPKVLNALQIYSGFSKQQILNHLAFGEGPLIKVEEMKGRFGYFNKSNGNKTLHIRASYVRGLEQAFLKSTQEATAFLLAVTILHEYVHLGRTQNNLSEGVYDFGLGFERDAFNVIVDENNAGTVVIKFSQYF
jgi:hypothetical protein